MQGWAGEIRLGDGVALFHGLAGDQHAHSHHAIQICAGGGIEVTADCGATVGAALAIPADLRHRLAPTSRPVMLAYLDPDSSAGQAVGALLAGRIGTLDDTVGERLAAMQRQAGPLRAWAVAAAAFPVLSPAGGRGPAGTVARVQAVMAAALDEPVWRPRDLARALDLSVDRLGRLFRAESGMQLRSWLKWQRLQAAIGLALNGEDLTRAAHGAGFADQAHLTRTMRATFGISPSSLFDRQRTVSFKPPA
ncbi:AraC family transcriptional regulator [Oleomonas cavernae]|uniref:AraC family transcriptional regulator n=2 Tax=Oleomonas cavernae TaxID=2320859 RepID=A0A418WD53_9PROT|nr:AraC family transcriptional regulator [Oleomonas cavernae]